ncbi:nucleotidyltransferase domain-containing protein [Eubacteriales bacterium OttesenSCG-928-M02]|nr:nucleotidyltransferase domain-containing protein [Eubacteriales bacterium OttesenSCG-928-M02]
MVDANAFIHTLSKRLQSAFSSRLLFVGLQGSYAWGNETAQSDIDGVVILDTISPGDIQTYRAILSTLPHGELACGFFAEKAVLLAWPRQELFSFYMDTQPIYGSLATLLPSLTQADVVAGIRTAAAGLYHDTMHHMLYDAAPDFSMVQGLYKRTFYLLQLVAYHNTGAYYHNKAMLLSHLTGTEKEILYTHLAFASPHAPSKESLLPCLTALLSWCRSILCSLVANV